MSKRAGLNYSSVDFTIEISLNKTPTTVGTLETRDNTRYLDDEDFTFEGEDISEAGMILVAIGATITNLFRLSGFIREAVPHDRFEKAVERSAKREYAFQSTPDVYHVQDKYPRLRNESMKWLRERLAQAITHRREYLRYCSEHQDHFKSFDSQDVTDETTVYGGTSASSVLPKAFEQLDLGGSRSSFSDTSSLNSESTVSVGEDYNDRLYLPPLDDVNGGASEFECPFCHIVLHDIDRQGLWK